ncbi:topoisomerase Spo11, putative [Acanthamoeba castellanii str. Neff]|uniref:DNA topoisomerase (ATP-hydrolyzing) n=1 Tax=Acanthamoeba castellanii (strain ATCC 30010 / Neff) TaxID=1257118 RepID=L8GHM7_ACACF|nr:topoisomerase Spo11, putative [Acanthamoeba castellanii str. Neff]ELR12359.1 topoisomerase Spo11, putative [Acanthamoeba castellanii str. Neff]
MSPQRRRDDVIKRLEAVLQRVLADIVAGRNAKLSFEEHHSYKSIEFDFVTKCHRPVAEPSLTTLALRSNKTLKSFVVMLRIMEVVHELLLSNKHATKRDIYYMDVTLFEKQAIVDRAIENIASMLHVPRTALHVVGTEKSLVAGHVNWKEKGDTIDCMHYLHTGKGVPDLAARRFVRMLKDTLPSLVVLALCDYDPWGLQILCTYAFGSLRMTYDAESLATPELLWLGVHDEDLKKWELPAACFANLTDVDKRKGETMLSMPALQAKPTWRNQLKSMLAGGKKIEMQALSSISISFLCDTFLPDKMAKAQWL